MEDRPYIGIWGMPPYNEEMHNKASSTKQTAKTGLRAAPCYLLGRQTECLQNEGSGRLIHLIKMAQSKCQAGCSFFAKAAHIMAANAQPPIILPRVTGRRLRSRKELQFKLATFIPERAARLAYLGTCMAKRPAGI